MSVTFPGASRGAIGDTPAPGTARSGVRAVARVARHPLVHFALLGGALFLLSPRREDARHVAVPSAALAALERAQAQRDAVPELSPDRAREVDARAIEDEILYRESLRLGLDRDDPIIRQRLVQKLLLLVEDMGGASREPTVAELTAYFEKDRARWRLPSRVHLVHVFATRRESLPDARGLAASGVPSAGEPFPYPREVTASKEEMGRVYGEGFAAAVTALEPAGVFSAPIASSFGWHRVRVVERLPGRAPSFEEARASLELDHALERREAIVGDYVRKTAAAYRIEIDGKPLVGFTPTRRVALRSDPSAED